MLQRTTTRTPEQGHTARCLAAAMIAAVENWRDYVTQEAAPPLFGRRHGALADPEDTVVPFRLWAQDNGALTEAESYLADGTMTCTCPAVAP